MPYYLMTTEELDEYEIEYDRECMEAANAILAADNSYEHNLWEPRFMYGWRTYESKY